MATTDANGIVFYEITDAVSPLQVLLNTGQQSVSNAIGTRAKLTKSLAASTPSSPVAGDTWYQTDTKAWGVYNGVWRFWDTEWQSYTPTVSGISLGSGTVTGLYKREGSTVRVRVIMVWGSGASGAQPRVTLPVTAVSGYYPPFGVIGYGSLHYATGSQVWPAVTTIASTTQAQINYQAAGSLQDINLGAPVAPTVGDVMSIEFSYRIP